MKVTIDMCLYYYINKLFLIVLSTKLMSVGKIIDMLMPSFSNYKIFFGLFILLLFLLVISIRWLSRKIAIKCIKLQRINIAVFCVKVYHHSQVLDYFSFGKLQKYLKSKEKTIWRGIVTRLNYPLIFIFIIIILLFFNFSTYSNSLFIFIRKNLFTNIYDLFCNIEVNILKSILKKSLYIFQSYPFMLVLCFLIFIYTHSRKYKIRKLVIGDEENSLKCVVELNIRLIYWLNKNLFNFSQQIDKIVEADRDITLLKVKNVGLQRRESIDVSELHRIINELFNESNIRVAFSYFIQNTTIFNMYSELYKLKQSTNIHSSFFTEEYIKKLDDKIINEEDIFDSIVLLYILFLGYNKLKKMLFCTRKEKWISLLMEHIKRIDDFFK